MRKFFGLCKFIPLTLCFVSSVASGELSEEQTNKLLEDLSLTVVLLTTPERVGTAFIIDDSTLVTNIHNLKDKHGKINIDQMSLTQAQRDHGLGVSLLYGLPPVPLEHKVIGIKFLSELHDLAILESNHNYWPQAQIPSTHTPPLYGEMVHTMGYPQGKFHIFKGMVVDKGGTDYIVALNGDGLHGLSGAPVFNEKGKVKGVIYRLAGNMAHVIPHEYLNLDQLPPDTYYKIAIRKEKTGRGETFLEKIYRVGGTHLRIFNAYRSLNSEVKKENAFAYFRWGEILRDRDEDLKAFHMFEKAAAGGSQNAQFALANLYVQRGERKKAITLLEDMLVANYPPALFNLGRLYLEEGKAHPENFQKAYDMFSRAVKMYHSGAMYNMGLMLWKGHGVEQNVEKAKKLFELAAILNFEPAKQILRESPDISPNTATGEYDKSPSQLSQPSFIKRPSCKEVLKKL